MIHRKIDNIEAEIAAATQIVGVLENYAEIIKPALIDQRFTLEARWRLFVAVESMLPIQSYGTHWGIHVTDCEYDDYGTERYQTVYFTDRLEMLEEMLSNYEENEESLRYTQEDIDAWKERVLASGYRGFVYDW